ncbi:helix-turn-helix transcriptional regulator [Vibrio sp. Of7-15]|uniref:AraC family transcriptional regulator n=1 Tax=Vibrio sp. Of7-15 TaxID=2724879 RepID=UPI001EF1F6A8|nr:helix-turn-helix transcriptional regulator [Vibrio sp. Of7-15]MCG7496976.1 helix-turn-helix transcriptional regulator [Vibrio sp. Of7-15]
MSFERHDNVKSGLSRRESNEQIAQAENQCVLARQVDMPAGHHGEFHTHTWYQLMYASEGVLNVEMLEQSTVIPPQRAVWVPPGWQHRTFSPAGAKFRSLYFRPDQVEGLGSACQVFNISSLIRELILAVVERCDVDEQWQPKDFRLLSVLLDQLGTQPQTTLSLLIPKDPRLAELVKALQLNPANSLSIEQWASKLGLSSRTLTRLFLADTGVGFKEWRQKVRLLHSLTLLEQGMSVTQAAFEVGYSSPSAFTYAFHQYFKDTPKGYFS